MPVPNSRVQSGLKIPMPPIRFRCKVERFTCNIPNFPTCANQPKWLTKASANPVELSLRQIAQMAARHFADAVVETKISPSGWTDQRTAMHLAWHIMALMRPTLAGDQLVFEPPKDRDIKKLAMELYGVGTGLSLLLQCRAITANSLIKVADRFDFTANLVGGRRTAFIELKGGFRDGNRLAQANHVKEKIDYVIGSTIPRKFSSAIGILFHGWPKQGRVRRADIEVMDPELESNDSRNERITRVVSFYGRAYFEAGLLSGSQRVKNMLNELVPIETASSADIQEIIGPISTPSHDFRRVSYTVQCGNSERSFWGSLWRSDFARVPYLLPEWVFKNRYCFVGVDSRIVGAMQSASWKELLEYNCEPTETAFQLGKTTKQRAKGFVLVLESGLCYVWTNTTASQVIIA